MSDPLDALTEALRDVYAEHPSEPGKHWEYNAAAILAHPAMADLARKARAWDEAQEFIEKHRGHGDIWFHDRGDLYCIADDESLVIAAALSAASPEEEK